MTIRNLDALLSPKSVAFVGASPKSGALGGLILRNLRRGGFKGPIFPVNPRYDDIEGLRCYASISDLPETPQLAIIATPAPTIPSLIAELGAKGTKAAVVITAGIKGPLRQAMLDAARPHLLRIQGPNCLGLMLPPLGLDATFSQCMPPAGDLAFVSQSGALITAIVDWAEGRGIGFSQVVSLGDMADVDFGDLLDYLAGDVKSRAILLYMEQLTHAAKFMSAARRAARSKPVIVIKAGRHAEGAKAALSHTGAMTGSDAAYDAAFRRAGLLRVTELEHLFSAAEMLSRAQRLEGERLMILTNGGGAGVLAADRLADLDGRMAVVSPDLVKALDGVLPATWSRGNPVDIIGDADAGRYQAALAQIMASHDADAILVMNCPTAMTSSTDVAKAVVDVRQEAATKRGVATPMLTCWLGDGSAVEGRRIFAREHIPTFDTPAASVEGYMQLVRHRRAQDELMRAPPPMPEEMTFDDARAREVISGALDAGRSTLTEVEAKRLIAAYGISTVPTEIARTPAEVRDAAARLFATHAACVIKVLSDDISHKSDVGGVRLNLESLAAAELAAHEMLARIAKARPDARIAGFTVQPMIQRPKAHELIVGMSVDPTFGPMILFGAGGTAVEVMRDTALALPPLDLKLARDLMQKTRVSRLLAGYRDRPAADLDAIAMTLVRISAMLIAHPEIREVDINPLLADENGVMALDARVRVESIEKSPRQPLAIRPYPSRWRRDEELPGLGRIILRPVRPEDEALYADFLARIAPSDMRLRFFVARPDLSHKYIARLTQIDYAREMAFVAIEAATGRMLGVCRLAADPDYTRAEYAIIVASDLKGRGLGWRLMSILVDYAKAERISELYGDVLAENTTMLAMCRELGFEIGLVPDDPGIRMVKLSLSR